MIRLSHLKPRAAIRLAVRLILLALAVLFAFGGPLPFWLKRIFPSLSPLSLIAAALAQRGWYAGLFWIVPPLVVLLMALLKGRMFCNWICPAGTLFHLVSPRKRIAQINHRRWSGYIFWIIIFSSLAGFPLLFILEPQPVLQRDLLWTGRGLNSLALIPGLIFPLFLVLGIFQPMIWCTHFCPAGHCFDFFRNLRKSPTEAFSKERRELLAGLCIGLPAAYAAAHLPDIGKKTQWLPALPPGAHDADQFGAICHRCYACVDSCPTGILRAGFRPDRPLVSWFQPEMNPNFGACEEFCDNCSRACPTGAIKKTNVDEKRMIQIGIAEVNREACLAWTDGEHCMVCDEFCPYGAIETSISETGIPRPIVNPEICRGCGFCQRECPAVRMGKAIIVRGLEKQRVLEL
ncbi:MAG: 4Fe-4S dicluster domain-containing protein [Kiritimatiellia bacterium]